MRRRYYVFIGWLLALGGIVPLLAQTTCPTIVETALSEIGDNCAGIERNSACYGYNRVTAAFTTSVEDNFFSRPADITTLAPLASVETAALNTLAGEWGVAVLSVQANLPDTLPGQAVTFILFGDTAVENAGTETETPVTPIEITVNSLQRVNLRSGAGMNYNAIDNVSPGVTLLADGISADGDWIRVAYNEIPAWIRADLVVSEGDFGTLPVISHQNPAPMQAFYLTTGIGQSNCQEAPDTLLVQGPENYEIELTINGANIQLGSTVLFRTVNESLEITVIDGEVRILPDAFNETEIIIPEGYYSAACLGAPTDAGKEGDVDDRPVACAWSEPQRANFNAWCSLENIPTNLLFYPVNMPCEEETPPTAPAVNQDTSDETPQEIIVRDIIPTPTTLPNGCADFRRISGGERMLSQYRWSAVLGADEYKLNLYDSNGQIVASRWVTAPNTGIDLHLADFPTGGAFQWEVEALFGGQALCSTGRSPMALRPGDTTPPGVPFDPFTARRVCTPFPSFAVVFWANAADNDTVTIITTGSLGDVNTSTGIGSSGSAGVAVTSPAIASIKVVTASGKEAGLFGCP